MVSPRPSIGLRRPRLHKDKDLVTWQVGSTVLADNMGMDISVATKERITCLSGLWGQKDATSGETCAGADFQQGAHEVLYECVEGTCQYLAKTGNVRNRHYR